MCVTPDYSLSSYSFVQLPDIYTHIYTNTYLQIYIYIYIYMYIYINECGGRVYLGITCSILW